MRRRRLTRTISEQVAGRRYEVAGTFLVCDDHVDSYVVTPQQERETLIQMWLLSAAAAPDPLAAFDLSRFLTSSAVHWHERLAINTGDVKRWCAGEESVPPEAWTRITILVRDLIAGEQRPCRDDVMVRRIER